MERLNQVRLGLTAIAALLVFSGCGNDNKAGAVTAVEQSPVVPGNGLASSIPMFTLKMDGAYGPLVYSTNSALELVQCYSDSPNVLVGCSTENSIVHLSAVALSGADATAVHFQVRNADELFDVVDVPVVVKASCQEIKDSGYAQENSTYIVHHPADAAGVNTQVYCTF